MNNIISNREWGSTLKRIKAPMIDLRWTNRKEDAERQKHCDEVEKRTNWRWELSVDMLRVAWPMEKIVPSNNPEDWGIKKEWIIEKHTAPEGHITWIYQDPTTGKTMLLWQWDENWGLVVEYDSDEHWLLCDHDMFFRMTSETPPRYRDTTHPNHPRSEKIRHDISNQVFKIMESFDPDFMKEFQKSWN